LLIYHAIECAGRHQHPCSKQVSGETAKRVDRLMREFLLPHALAYYTDILGAASDLEHARWVAGHILSKTLDVVNNRDLIQAYKQWRGLDEWRRVRIMQTLEDMGWVTPVDIEKGKRRGATMWAVNMRVHGLFSAKAQLEAEKRAKIHADLQALRGKG
jgi:hypothetical protein